PAPPPGAPAPPPPAPAPPPEDAPPGGGAQVVDTANERLDDGVNRCLKCGSTEIQLRPSTGMLVCLFCRYEWSEAKVDTVLAAPTSIGDLRGVTLASGASDISSDADLVTMKCSGCGSEVVVNTAEAMSSQCHWCRHVLTVNEQVPNGAVPDAVLPFSVTREQAIEKIKEFAGKRKLLAHRKFRDAFAPEDVSGVYLPYMVVDANASADVHGRGEVLTRRYTRGSGDKQETVYDADVYRVDRHVDFTVDDLTLESSADRANMNTFVNTNNVINTILPFDTENAVQWNAHYLVGYTSERRDQDVSAMMPVLGDQLLSIARSQVHGSIRSYDRGVRWEAERLTLHGSQWVSMYLPVWLYSYYHEGRGKPMVHYIAVNGRTGETMGSIAVSHPRLILAALTTGTVLEGIAVAIMGVL
ncbi:MAG: hypothetical protein QM621_13320, partial [Aeromicrobium sp.]|uniref:hypothetical protein n=1 Tax=Aeromicrobium sp. TaxID=1871063 RepID=UPI0039E70B7A